MAFYRFYPTSDTFITNALRGDSGVRATDANLGSNPSLQLFKLTGSVLSQTARTLISFDSAHMSGLIYDQNIIPMSGVTWVLRCFDYEVGEPHPTSFDLNVACVSGAWDEGIGQDDRGYSDLGYANWLNSTSIQAWATPGGDYYTSPSLPSQHFDSGEEDLDIDVTTLVADWFSSSLPNNGFLIKLGNAEESNNVDYYRKIFYSSQTHIVEKMPYLEARWDDVRKDNRGNFAFAEPNSLYLYNFIRGRLQDVANPPLKVTILNNLISGSATFQADFSASQVETGVYVAPIFIQTPPPTILFSSSLSASLSGAVFTSSFTSSFTASWVDIWTDFSASSVMTGNFSPVIVSGSIYDQYSDFVVNPVGLKRAYMGDEVARIAVKVRRERSSSPLARHTASLTSMTEYMEDMYFSIKNSETGETIVPFGTGSVPYTQLSYDKNGNYFFLSMNSFVPGFTYKLVFLINYNKYERTIIDNNFEFKVL